MLKYTEPTATKFGPSFGFPRDAPRVEEGPPEAFDPFLGDAELAAASNALNEGSWELAERVLEHGATGHRIHGLADHLNDHVGVAAWAETAPSPASHTVLGLALLARAWPDQAFDQSRFNDMIGAAEAHFVTALGIDPLFIQAHIGQIEVAKFRSQSSTAQGHFEQVHAVVPFHADAVTAMVKALAPKWGGTEDAMLEFARWAVEHSPAASPVKAAIADAHFEIAIERLKNDGLDPLDYMLTKDVLVELRDALKIMIDGDDALGSGDDRAPIEYVHALNMFLFFIGIDNAEGYIYGRRSWYLVGDRPTWSPWAYFAEDATPNRYFKDFRFQRAWGMEELKKKIEASNSR